MSIDPRELDKTEPPTNVYVADPGAVLAALVTRTDGDPVGAVWVAVDQTMIPRAGIVNTGDPDLRFQQLFGELTLTIRRDSTVDAAGWLATLRDDLSGGPLRLGPSTSYARLDDVRRVTGLLL